MSDSGFTACGGEQIRTAIREATVHVLETMFFVSPAEEDPVTGGIRPLACHTARIVFHGDWNGAFAIRVPDGMARTITANFLAENESDVLEERVKEVVCEFANMVCGATLSAIAPRARLDLSTPDREAAAPTEGEVYSDCLLSDCGRMEMRMELWASA